MFGITGRDKPPAAEPVDGEQRIAELDVMILTAKESGDMPRVDRLLDMRLAIRPPKPLQVRPSAPVVPGWS